LQKLFSKFDKKTSRLMNQVYDSFVKEMIGQKQHLKRDAYFSFADGFTRAFGDHENRLLISKESKEIQSLAVLSNKDKTGSLWV